MLEADTRLYSHAHVAGLKRLSARANAPLHSPARKVFFSFSDYGCSVISALKAHKVQIDPPLSEAEFQRIEATFKFCFPPDLRGILQEGLPVGPGFPDWRNPESQQLRLWMKLPVAGICEAVEQGEFWWKRWGPQPKDLDQAITLARTALKKAPILVPVYGHCYIPSSPNHAGNPVFFIYRMKAVNCAVDVCEFFQQELFLLRHQDAAPAGNVNKGLDGWGLNWAQSERGVESWDISDGSATSSDASSQPEQEQRVSKSLASSGSSGNRSSWESLDENPDPKFYSSEVPSSLALISENELMKATRRIDFWSDFVAQRQKRIATAEAAQEPIQAKEVDRDPTEPKQEDRRKIGEEAEGLLNNSTPKWLDTLLDNISTCLRNAGWKEDDITEIVDASSQQSGGKIPPLDRQSVLEGLALQLDLLSASLRKAGWSCKDVAESLSFDLAFYDNHAKPPLQIPPKLTAQFSSLAAYVTNA